MNLAAVVKSRAGAILAGAIVFLGVFLALAGPSWELAVYRLLQDGGCAVLWLAAAGGIGWIIWQMPGSFYRRDRRERGESESNSNDFSAISAISAVNHSRASLEAVTCVGLGLGLMSLAILVLGLCGWMNQAWAVGILAVGDFVAISLLYVRTKNWDVGLWLRGSAGWGWLWIAAGAVGGAAALAACFPPGLLWGDEPNGYDVVEYHLQVPREWFEAGRIVPLHHNVFSFFPFNVETHYLLAMFLHGGPWAGMYLDQMMHLGFCAAAAWAVFALAGGPKRGTVAALLVAATPWTGLLASVAYNEGGTLLFATLAIGWAIRAQTFREFVVAGLFAGFAGGTKLSVAPLVFLGVPLAAIIKNAIPLQPRVLVAHLACYVLAGVLALSPWLIRNWKWTGNPVFPQAMNLLGQGYFSPVQVERWQQAYLPDADHRSVAGHLRALDSQVGCDWRYGYVLLPLGIVALVLGIGNRAVLGLSVLLFFQMAFWICFTHLQSRFMVMAIPIIALMIARIELRAWLPLCAAAGLAIAGFSTSMLIQKMARFLHVDHTKVPLIGRENLEGFRQFDTRRLTDDKALDLVGDACAFYYQIPMSRLHYKTVFDVDTSDPTKSIDQAWLAGMPTDAVIYRDSSELKRFARTYYRIKLMPQTSHSSDK